MNKLTIIIPTHNGSKFLLETLIGLKSQIVLVPPNLIDLLVVNSGSSANESKDISAITRSLGVTLFVQEDNLGYDLNVLRAISQCNSEYFWLFGDDDLPLEGCIEELVSAIDNSEIDLAVFSAVLGSNPSADFSSQEKLVKANDLDLFDEVVKAPFLGAAMSTCVFKRKSFLSVELGDFVGLDWIHHSAILQMAVHRGNFKLSRLESRVFIRQNSDRWKAHFGSQYLAGLRHLESSSRLAPGDKGDAIRTSMSNSRFKTNHLDALGLGFSLTWQEKISAFGFTRRHFAHEPRFWLVDVPFLFILSILWPTMTRITAFMRSVSKSLVK